MKRTVLFGILAALQLPLVSSVAIAQSPSPTPAATDEARERYKRGMQLYDEGNLEAAFIEFQRAYELAPSYKILYNLGLVHKQQNDYAAALKAFQRYLREGGAEVASDRRAEVQRDVDLMQTRIGTLEVLSKETGAEVSVDDVPVGKVPLPGGIAVNAGRHRVSIAKEGMLPTTQVVTVAGKDKVKVQIEPVAKTSAAEPPRPSSVSTPPPAPRGDSATVPWIAWGLTGAFAVGATVTGIMSVSASSDLKDARTAWGESRSSLDSKQSKVSNLAIATDVLAGAALVSGVLSLYLTLNHSSPAPSDRKEVSRALGFDAGLGSLLMRGSF